MSDSEGDDDYMSDKLIPKSEDVRPSLLFNRTVKREHEQHKKREAYRALQPKSETELREIGLNTALASDNKGFQLLAKMGFKPGQGLGKANSGRTEPIAITVRQGTSGVGRRLDQDNGGRSKKRRTAATKQEERVDLTAETLDAFKRTKSMETAERFLRKDFINVQKACEELDFRKDIRDPIEDFFWTKETIKKRRNFDDSEDGEEDEDEFEIEFNQYINGINLMAVIDYLREKHLYCVYCGFVATDQDDLKINCAGPYRQDHDND